METKQLTELALYGRSTIIKALALTVLSTRDPEKIRQLQRKMNKIKNEGAIYDTKSN